MTGLAQAAEPTLRNAPGALVQTTKLLRVARPGLRLANPTLHLLNQAVPPALGFLHTTQPELPRINQATRVASPLVTYLAPRACGISQAAQWDDFQNVGTSYTHYIQFVVRSTSGVIVGAPGALSPAVSDPYTGPCLNATTSSTGPIIRTPEQQVALLHSLGYQEQTTTAPGNN